MNKPLNPWKLTGYKAGQNVACKIVAPEPGGYAVIIPKDNLPGFLPTEDKFSIGEEILAQYVCIHNNRMLLASRFAAGSSSSKTSFSGNIQEQKQDGTEQEQAFAVWAESNQRTYHLRRATDLILPPIDKETLNSFAVSDYDLEWLITDLEGGMRTGCVKTSAESKLSRAAMLVYKGRAVGCIYGCKSMPETHPTEPSLSFMLKDLEADDAKVTFYDLPEDIVLSMSALFLGYPVDRAENISAREYMDYLLNWFSEKVQTACLAINLPTMFGTCLVFVHAGKFVGSFYVEDQHFSTDIAYVHELLNRDDKAILEASILPPELMSSSVRYGFSVSMAMKKN